VDIQRRQLDFRVCVPGGAPERRRDKEKRRDKRVPQREWRERESGRG